MANASNKSSGIVETICGRTAFVDGTPALDRWIGYPFGLALDGSGNLHFSDKERGQVFVKRKDGKLYSVAGTGETSFSGDGGLAKLARLHQTHGLAIDSQGNLYLSDAGNRRIRCIDSQGVIRTVIGTGQKASLPLGNFPKNGLPALQTPLADPVFMVFDARGMLWISDMVGRRIYRYEPASGQIHVVTDYETGGPMKPMGMAVVEDKIFVIDNARKWIMTVDANTGKSEGWLGGIKHQPRFDFSDPYGLCFDGKKYLFVSDQGSDRIIRIDINERKPELFAGGGCGMSGTAEGSNPRQIIFQAPSGLAIATDGTLYVADRYGSRRGIRAISPDGSTRFVAGCALTKPESTPIGDGGVAKGSLLHFPRGIAVDAGGNIFVSDCNHRRIRKIDRTTGMINTVLGNGSSKGGRMGGDPKAANLWSPRAIRFDRAGNLFVVDINFKGILKLDVGANRVDWLIQDARLLSPANLAIGLNGEAYVTDAAAGVVWMVNSRGELSVFAGNLKETGFRGDGKPVGESVLNRPNGVAVGIDGEVYISDTDNHRIRVVRDGVIQTYAGTGVEGSDGVNGPARDGLLKSPRAMMVDETGNLFVTDALFRICKIEKATGLLRHVAGASYGFGGDGGPATEAQFNQPADLAVWRGELYIADNTNHAIRRVTGV